MSAAAILRPVSTRAFVALLLANLAVRLWLATLPGYFVDVQQYKEWAVSTALHGVSAAYESPSVDYPPVMLYPMWVAGEIYLLFEDEVVPGKVLDSRTFTFLVKSPHILFDFTLAALLLWLVGRCRTWGESRAGLGWGRLAALLYLWNPAVLWVSGYWGQPDGAHSALIVAAVAALAMDRSATGGALLSLAGLTKPLAAPIVPLLGWASLARTGMSGALRWIAGGCAAAVLAFAPFIVTGRVGEVVRRILVDVEAMPFTSVNAHNVWWILGPWRDASIAVVGPVTPKHIGILLFLGAYLALMIRIHGRLRDGVGSSDVLLADLFLATAAVTSAFFFLSTHMHENHLFMTLPLLLVIAGRDRALAMLALGCSAAVLLNTVLHDVELPYRLGSVLGAPSPVLDRHLDRPYTWVQLVGSFLDTLLVAAVVGGIWRKVWRGRP